MFSFKKIKTLVMAFTLLLFLSLNLTSFAGEAKKKVARSNQAALTYLNTIGLGDFRDTFMQGVEEQLEQSFALIAKRHAGAESAQIINRYRDALILAYRKDVNWDVMEQAYVKKINDKFSEQELKKLNKFFSTELGEKVIEQQQGMAAFGTQIFIQESSHMQAQMTESFQALATELSQL